jgi:hypothetical protein
MNKPPLNRQTNISNDDFEEHMARYVIESNTDFSDKKKERLLVRLEIAKTIPNMPLLPPNLLPPNLLPPNMLPKGGKTKTMKKTRKNLHKKRRTKRRLYKINRE